LQSACSALTPRQLECPFLRVDILSYVEKRSIVKERLLNKFKTNSRSTCVQSCILYEGIWKHYYALIILISHIVKKQNQYICLSFYQHFQPSSSVQVCLTPVKSFKKSKNRLFISIHLSWILVFILLMIGKPKYQMNTGCRIKVYRVIQHRFK